MFQPKLESPVSFGQVDLPVCVHRLLGKAVAKWDQSGVESLAVWKWVRMEWNGFLSWRGKNGLESVSVENGLESVSIEGLVSLVPHLTP